MREGTAIRGITRARTVVAGEIRAAARFPNARFDSADYREIYTVRSRALRPRIPARKSPQKKSQPADAAFVLVFASHQPDISSDDEAFKRQHSAGIYGRRRINCTATSGVACAETEAEPEEGPRVCQPCRALAGFRVRGGKFVCSCERGWRVGDEYG